MRRSWAFATVTALCAASANAQFLYAGCDVSDAIIRLPSHQTTLTVPTEKPNSIALGVGVQNYTCSAAGNYTSAGAVAEFYDISCLRHSGDEIFDVIQSIIFPFWNQTDKDFEFLHDLDDTLKAAFFLDIHLGTHFFQPSPSGTGISPVFDYRAASRLGDPNGFVLAAANISVPAPTGPHDVNWLRLTGVQGDLGAVVMRVDTVAGQPPASCEPGSGPISVKYAAKYWFFGGTPSPLVEVFEEIANDAWNAAEHGGPHYDASSKPGSNLAVDDSNSNNTGTFSAYNPKSSAFPLVLGLTISNAVLAIGILAASIMYYRKSKSMQSLRYVSTGAKHAPHGALDEIEQEMGPYDAKEYKA